MRYPISIGCRSRRRYRCGCILIFGCAFFFVRLLVNLDLDLTSDISGPLGPRRNIQKGNVPNQKHNQRNDSVQKPVLGLPVLDMGKLGSYEPSPQAPRRTGLGEYAVKIDLDPAKKDIYHDSMNAYGFNVALSDEISLDRAVPDIRSPQCEHWHYPKKLPNASVVIAFSNEGFSTLLRTVHSVINASPPDLLADIVMVDDMSDKEHLGKKLVDYISQDRFQGKIQLIRNTKREGLAKTRSNGAMAAKGEVVVFLDAHCECGVNWLPPLLAEIAYDRTTVTCPTVDVLSAEDLSYHAQGDLARGAFDWAFWYKRIPLSYGDTVQRIGMKYTSQAYDSPVMAGGLFAMDRSYFIELGAYDPGLFIWGGENYEISFKIWMCGGRLKFVPCSRVGHIYRHGVPYKYPSIGRGISIVDRNFMRVAEVWMDEYKDYFYTFKPRLKGKDCGNITEQVNFRKNHCTKSFKWYMENVAFDTLELFPIPPPNRLWGSLKSQEASVCLDTMGRQSGSIGATACHFHGGNQEFRLVENGRIQFDEYCLAPSVNRKTVSIKRCRDSNRKTGNLDFWNFNEVSGHLQLRETNLCVNVGPGATHDVSLLECSETSLNQKFTVVKPTNT